MTSSITIAKGSYSVTIETADVTEHYADKLFFIRPPQSTQNQPDGSKDTKVIDLLMITHTIIVRGVICADGSKTADKIKADLIEIQNGAGIAGTPCTLTWDSHLDAANSYAASVLSMYVEKLTFTENSMDYNPGASDTQVMKYDVVVTLVAGTKI